MGEARQEARQATNGSGRTIDTMGLSFDAGKEDREEESSMGRRVNGKQSLRYQKHGLEAEKEEKRDEVVDGMRGQTARNGGLLILSQVRCRDELWLAVATT